MSSKSTGVIALFLALIGGGTAAYYGLKTTVSLTAPSSVQIGKTADFTVQVKAGISKVSNVSVSVVDTTTQQSYTGMTDSSGTASVSINFEKTGTHTLYATYNNVKSTTVSVNVHDVFSQIIWNISYGSTELGYGDKSNTFTFPDSQAGVITISGQTLDPLGNAYPSQAISISVNGTQIDSVTSDSNGNFSKRYTVPANNTTKAVNYKFTVS